MGGMEPIFRRPISADITWGNSASTYNLGSVIGTLQSITVPGTVQNLGPIVTIDSLILIDPENFGVDLWVYVFDSAPVALVDTNVFNPNAADLARIVDVIKIKGSDDQPPGSRDYVDLLGVGATAQKVAVKQNMGRKVRVKSAGSAVAPILYFALVCQAANVVMTSANDMKSKIAGFVE